MKIETLSYEDLTDEEKEDVPDNGSGKEYACYIKIAGKGKTLLLKSDAMEPEDASFCRDLDWIVSALQEVYNLGLEDGKQQ